MVKKDNSILVSLQETIHKKCCTCSSAQANNQKREYRMLSRAKRRYGQPESSEYSGKQPFSLFYAHCLNNERNGDFFLDFLFIVQQDPERMTSHLLPKSNHTMV